MNKRIKFKKGILHKKCDDKCYFNKAITREKLITNNCCIGCKHRAVADEIVAQNCKEKGVKQIILW